MAVPPQLKIARIMWAFAAVSVVFAALVYAFDLFSGYSEETALLLLVMAATQVVMSALILRPRS